MASDNVVNEVTEKLSKLHSNDSPHPNAVTNKTPEEIAADRAARKAAQAAKKTKEKKETPIVTPKVRAAPLQFVEVPRVRRAFSPNTRAPVAGQRNVLITSALPYVNNVPHLGNIIGCVLSADVYSRYCRLRGINSLYICGTDEYGTATEAKAQEEGLRPREICNKYHTKHRAIYDWFDISFDHFGRTSTNDPWKDKTAVHSRVCQSIFQDILEHGNLLEEPMDQMYCLDCEKFLADRFIEGTCPHCQYDDARGDQCDKCGKVLNPTELVNPSCKFGRAQNHRVEQRQSRHLFLDLPKLEPKLTAWIETASAQGNWTSNAQNITNAWLKEGLRPRCITRDLKWGVPVPHPSFQDKVFYVWFDAPMGYISITADLFERSAARVAGLSGEDSSSLEKDGSLNEETVAAVVDSEEATKWKKWWKQPQDVQLYQFMGKDNVPFHTVIFPAALIGTEGEWTKVHHVSTTEYLNYETGKFSKSRGVGVFGDNAQATGIPSEVWRYYLLSIRPEMQDSTFVWTDFQDKVNNELLKNIGNLVNRASSFAYATFEGCIPGSAVLNDTLGQADLDFLKSVSASLKTYFAEMDAVKLRSALRTVFEIGTIGNTYMQESKPWESKTIDLVQCKRSIVLIMALVRLLAALLEPFMPGFTDKVAYITGLPHTNIPDEFSVESIQQLLPLEDHPFHVKPTPLFAPITDEDIAKFKTLYGGKQEVEGATAAVAVAATPTASTKSAQKDSKLEGLPDVAKVDIRVGRIVRAWPHPELEKLWCEEIDVGEGVPRTIASGLRAFYENASDLEGRLVSVVCNLKPRTMGGFASNGMVLCVSSPDKSRVQFLEPKEGSVVGERITLPGVIPADAPFPVPEIINTAKKNNPWTAIADKLLVDADGSAVFEGVQFSTSMGPLKSKDLTEGTVG